MHFHMIVATQMVERGSVSFAIGVVVHPVPHQSSQGPPVNNLIHQFQARDQQYPRSVNQGAGSNLHDFLG
jgi:hypothetical protein